MTDIPNFALDFSRLADKVEGPLRDIEKQLGLLSASAALDTLRASFGGMYQSPVSLQSALAGLRDATNVILPPLPDFDVANRLKLLAADLALKPSVVEAFMPNLVAMQAQHEAVTKPFTDFVESLDRGREERERAEREELDRKVDQRVREVLREMVQEQAAAAEEAARDEDDDRPMPGQYL